MTKHRCVRSCHYLQRLWRVGEIIEDTPGFEDAPPGKHFLPIGAEPTAADQHVKTAGDDPRSTDVMTKALESYGVEVGDGMTRKQIFNKLIKFEQTDGRSLGDKEADVVAGTEGGAADPELPQKAVSELSPDEIETTTVKQMVAMISRDRGVVRSPAGQSKANLFEIDLKLAREKAAKED